MRQESTPTRNVGRRQTIVEHRLDVAAPDAPLHGPQSDQCTFVPLARRPDVDVELSRDLRVLPLLEASHPHDPPVVDRQELDRKQEPGDNGQRTTARALMASTVVTTAPEPGATLTMGGLTWTIGEAEIVGTNGSAILYKLALWHG